MLAVLALLALLVVLAVLAVLAFVAVLGAGIYQRQSAASRLADLRGQLTRLEPDVREARAVGIDQVLSVDLTRPDIGIPVVRVVIPGLESLHDIPGAVPGARARAVRSACAADLIRARHTRA